MAQIKNNDTNTLLAIHAFLGLSENPDGDTKLKVGELSEMRNFRITRDGHLQIRPGTKTLLTLPGPFYGVWSGTVGTAEHLVVSAGGTLYDLLPTEGSYRAIGTAAEAKCSFFGFGGKVYLLDGSSYKSWDGGEETVFQDVEGYIPIVVTACTPDGQGTLLEAVNRLTPLRRVQYSPDGEATVFTLPETEVESVSAVAGTSVDWSYADGAITFKSAPAAGVNTVTVTYRKGEGARDEVTAMRCWELYGGVTDSRVFLYGDGTNRILYSGLDEWGRPSAEYFPDLCEAAVGEANTPVTALVRHYARLLAFKPGSAWSIAYGVITLADGSETAAFYVQPVNRSIGGEAMGQAVLLENDPVTLCDGSVYRWSTGVGALTQSETNARRISDGVRETLGSFWLRETTLFDRKAKTELFLLQGDKALIYNYGLGGWYVYREFPFTALAEFGGELYGFTAEGAVRHISHTYRGDDSEPITAYAATGAMDFAQSCQVKYSPELYVALEPESNARVAVAVESNRRSDYPEKVVSSGLATLQHVDFAHFSFATNRKPQVRRVKLKVKKATFYKLIFKSSSASATATVLQADIAARYGNRVR